MKIKIGNTEFPSKEQAKKFFSDMYKRHLDGEPITSDSPDFQPLCDLVELHPRAQFKIYQGIDFFTVEQNEYATYGFYCHSTCGQKTDFSFIRCIDGDKGPFQKVCNACRRIIEPQIIAFRLVSSNRCQITGSLLAPGESHVDHHPVPFCVIVNRWLKENNLHPAFIKLDHTGISQVFLDKNLNKSFFDYHSKFSLRLIKKEINCSLANQAKNALKSEQ